MNIGIDIDDTITETTLVGNKYLKYFDNTYRDYHDLPLERYYDFINLYLPSIVQNNLVKEGVKEAFAYFKEHHHKIILITARNDLHVGNIKKLTIEFLNNNDIPYDKIEFDDSGIGDKSEQAINNQIDLFIDDKESVLDKVSVCGIECIRLTNDKNSKYKTFSNWNDIIKYIETK